MLRIHRTVSRGTATRVEECSLGKHWFLLFGLLLPLASEAAEPLHFRVKRQLHLPSDDGQQGIGTDGKFLFVQNSQQLFKYDLDGNLIQAGPKLQLHHGGIVCLQGRVYVAVSGCESTGTDQHLVHVYDAQSLALIEKHEIGVHFTVCAGGIAHRRGHFFVAESFFDDEHLDRIVEFDEAFQFVKDHTVNFKSPSGIQGLEYLPATDQFQVHSHGKDFYRINASFESHSLIAGQAEFELQDVTRLDAKTLVVNHRHAESVWFIDLEMQPTQSGQEGAFQQPLQPRGSQTHRFGSGSRKPRDLLRWRLRRPRCAGQR